MKGRKRSIVKFPNDIDFQKLAKKAKHPRERMRYLAFAHMRDGKSNSEIAAMLKVHRMTIVDLVWISGRSKHPKVDLEAQSTFKKTSGK